MKTGEITLIVGGTGKTGRRVEQRLAAREIPCRVASRSGSPAFDWDDENTWAANLEEVARVYLTYYPDLAAPSAAPVIQRFSELSVDSGVKKIVLLSGRGEPQVRPSERAVEESGANYTILRSAFFCQNFSEAQWLGSLLEGELAFPAGKVTEPFIDAGDLADVAVAALTNPQADGKIYELTGPRLLSFEQALREISDALGRTIRYRAISKQEYGELLAPYFPPEVVGFLCDLFACVLDGHNSHLSDDVERVLGRPARDFADWARETAATGVWSTERGVGR